MRPRANLEQPPSSSGYCFQTVPSSARCLFAPRVSAKSKSRESTLAVRKTRMAELKTRQWILAARPQGLIKESDFRWNETTVAALKDGQVLVRNLAFSFDPTQRGWMSMDTYMPAIALGQTMKAGTVGQVVDSKR